VSFFIHPALYWIFALAVLLPALGVLVRRLHDAGYSAWWILIALIPLIGGLIQLYMLLQPSKMEGNSYA
jgi:uncharacterized membrane protein YhaH (DUF805 family)